jgi:chaperonin GroES
MKIRPINDKVIVQFVEPKDKTPSGVIIPGVAKRRPSEAIVLAVGSGKLLRNGMRKPMPVKVGDEVLVSYSGQELKDRDENLRIVGASDVLAVMK